MIPRFRRSAAPRAAGLALCTALGLLPALTGCEPEPTASAQVRLPHADLCRALDQADLTAALLGPVSGCSTGGNPDDGYVTVLTSAPPAAKGDKPRRAGGTVTLTISYGPRYDVRSGTDRWQGLSAARGSRVPLIGVGDQATFDPRSAPNAQLTAVKGGVVLAVGLQVAGAAVPQDQLPDHLMDLARDTFQALAPAATGTPVPTRR